MWRRTFNRIIQTLIILAVVYFTLIGGFVTGIREYPWRVTTEVLLLFILGGWLLKKLVARENLLKTPLDGPVLGLIVVSIGSAIFSTDPRVSWEIVFINILLTLLFFFTLELTIDRNIKTKIINAVLIIGGVIAAIGLFEFWQWYGGQLENEVNWRLTGLKFSFEDAINIKSVLHNRNYLAYYLLAVLGLSLGKTVNAKRWWQGLGWIIYAFMILVTLTLTKSRGGALGALTIIFAYIALLWFMNTRLKLQNKWFAYIGPTIILPFAGLFVFVIVSRTTFSLSSSIPNERIEFWQASLKMWQDYPLTGIGPGAFPLQYLLYRNFDGGGVPFIITHAHNVWFTIIAEYGLLGLGAVVWLVAAFVKAIFNGLRQPPANKSDFVWLITGLAVLAGQSMHNFFDDFLEFPVYTWYTIFMVTICLAPQINVPARLHTWPKRTVLAAVAALIIGLGAVWINRGFAAYHQAVLASHEENWPLTAAWLEKAVALDPFNNFYQQQLALAYGWIAYTAPGKLPEAVASQQKVVDQNNLYPLDKAHLGCLYWEQGNPQLAISAMSQAAQTEALLANYAGLKSWHTSATTYYFNLGFYYENVGNILQAKLAYKQSIQARPEIAGSIFWQQSDQRRQLLQEIIQEVNQEDWPASVILQANYFAGNYQALLDISKAQLAQTPNDVNARLMLVKAMLELGNETEARNLFNQIIATQNIEYSLVYLDLISDLGDLDNRETAVKIAAVLGGESASPAVYYYWGQLAEAENDFDKAISQYQEAINRATLIDTDYANLIGRRLPLAQEKMPCLLLPYAVQELSAPSLRLAALYQLLDRPQAALAVYRNLLFYEPYNQLAQEDYKQLCRRASVECASFNIQ